jgi:hypothetical protein
VSEYLPVHILIVAVSVCLALPATLHVITKRRQRRERKARALQMVRGGSTISQRFEVRRMAA